MNRIVVAIDGPGGAGKSTVSRTLAKLLGYQYVDTGAMYRVIGVLAAEQGIDILLLSVGHDLPYLTGYLAMPLERLTMLVLPREGDATLVVPRLEAPRVVEQPGVFTLLAWNETEDPIEIVARLASHPTTAAIGDQTWARFLVDLLPLLLQVQLFVGDLRADWLVGKVLIRQWHSFCCPLL